MQYIEATPQGTPYDRSDGLIAVVIVYRRAVEWTDRVLGLRCGEFTHCEIFIPKFSGTFVTTIDFGMELRTNLKNNYMVESKNYAWHLIPMTCLEYQRLCEWNMEQVKRHCKYNYKDILWLATPYPSAFVHDLSIQDATHPQRLFCSQAVVLALRAAFSCRVSNPHMYAFVNSMNSRITTPGDLHAAACLYLGVPSNDNIVPINVNDVNVYTTEMINNKKINRRQIYG